VTTKLKWVNASTNPDDTEIPLGALRFVKREGRNILQMYCFMFPYGGETSAAKWVDIPLVTEG
jgi:hypothetical protein